MITALVTAAKGFVSKMYSDLSQSRMTYGEIGRVFSVFDDTETLKTYRTLMRELCVNPWDVVRKAHISYESAEVNLERLTELGLASRHYDEQFLDFPLYSITEKGVRIARML